jgi:HAD superfamily hydrolase (TIGR01509 family)
MQFDISPYQVVLFDVDGTMAETEGLGHLPAFNAAFEQASLPWQWDVQIYKELLQITGGLERLKGYRAMMQSATKDLSQLPSDAVLKNIHLAKNQFYAQLMAQGKVVSRPGLVRFINQLSLHGKQWGVVTTTSHSNWASLWQAVLKNSIQTEPAVVVCGEDVTKKKPDPQAYQLAAQKLGLDPRRCLAVEDSDNGVLSALRAQIEVLVVRSQFFAEGNFTGAKLVVNEFTELNPI